MATNTPYIKPECPALLNDAVAKRHITREAAEQMAAWAWDITLILNEQEQRRVYTVALEGEVSGAIEQFGLMLKALQKQAIQHSACGRDDDMATRWRKYHGAELLRDHLLKHLQWRVMGYLPELIEVDYDEQRVEANKQALRQVIQTYGWHRATR